MGFQVAHHRALVGMHCSGTAVATLWQELQRPTAAQDIAVWDPWASNHLGAFWPAGAPTARGRKCQSTAPCRSSPPPAPGRTWSSNTPVPRPPGWQSSDLHKDAQHYSGD